MTKAHLLATYQRLLENSRKDRIRLAEELATTEFGPRPSKVIVDTLIGEITRTINAECGYLGAIYQLNVDTQEELDTVPLPVVLLEDLPTDEHWEQGKLKKLPEDSGLES